MARFDNHLRNDRDRRDTRSDRRDFGPDHRTVPRPDVQVRRDFRPDDGPA